MKLLAAAAATAMLTLLVAAGPAAASGPINAPTPTFPQVETIFRYMTEFDRKQSLDVNRASRIVDRWVRTRPGSSAERRTIRQHRTSTRRTQSNLRALNTDLAILGGCKGSVTRSQSKLIRNLLLANRAMVRGNFGNLLKAERGIAFELGAMEFNSFQLGFCATSQNGWVFAEETA